MVRPVEPWYSVSRRIAWCTPRTSVCSAPVQLPPGGCGVSLNADLADRMTVEVTDEQFRPVPGFSGPACGRATAAGGLDCRVRWPAGGLQPLGGRTVRFQVRLRNTEGGQARLYAVYLRALGEKPMTDENQSVEFTVNVGSRRVAVLVVSPPPGKLAAKPALYLTFAGAREESLFGDPYDLTAKAFLEAGHRVASFDLPCHGARLGPFGEGIPGLRDTFLAGQDPFAGFVEEGQAVITECLRRGLATAHRLAVGGTSRGGYLALRLLAGDDRIAGGAGFAPVTDWRILEEFAAQRPRRDVAALRLSRFVAGMVGRPVFLAIGGSDERVGTRSCQRLHRDLVAANAQAGLGTPVKFVLTEDVGHSMTAPGYAAGADFLLQQFATPRQRE